MIASIGIVGGVGPYAGIRLFESILKQVDTHKDQDHLPVSLFSLPSTIPDRSDFLLNQSTENPANAIADIVCKLAECGAIVVGIPCNTAHAPAIFNKIQSRVGKQTKVINMIEEIADYIEKTFTGYNKVGVLATSGTYHSHIYDNYLRKKQIEIVNVSEAIQNQFIHPAIYDEQFGIKSTPDNTEKLTRYLDIGIKYLRDNGAQAIILGCTELPLVSDGLNDYGIPLISSTDILATALVREFHHTVT